MTSISHSPEAAGLPRPGNGAHPPGPPGRFLVGNLPEFRRDILSFYTENAREYGDLFAFRLGSHAMVLVSHPELIEQVLVTQNRNFVKHWILDLLRPILGNGLLNSDGEFWLRQRRLIQPLFNAAHIASYGDIAISLSDRFSRDWRDGEVREIQSDMKHLTLAIVARALLDIDVSSDFDLVARSIDVIQEDFRRRFTSIFPPPMWLPTPSNLRLKSAVRQLDSLIYRIIDERHQSPQSHDDLLSRLLAARDQADQTGMSDRQVRDEVMTLFLAGHETTAITLSWTLYLLSRHPGIQDRVRQELETVFGGGPPTVEKVASLRLTRNVVRESMRLYPPAYAFGRRAVAACQLGEYEIAAGTTVLISPWVVHRDARFYPEPAVFDPDRWTSEFENRIPKYAYVPFGGGPRICIGNNFAMLESQLALAMLLSRFAFEPLSDAVVPPVPAVTLQPGTPVPLKVRRLDGFA